MKAIVIGAGAAGCFCAIQLKRLMPTAEVVIYEAGRRPLMKVAITGGGRCNLTNSFEAIGNLSEAYPRGAQLMKRALSVFDQNDICQWFENEGVPVVLQDDHCVFPESQDAMQIVNTLLHLLRKHGVQVHCSQKATLIEEGYRVTVAGADGALTTAEADFVVVTTGGSPRARGFAMLEPLGLEIVPPVPSLFTLNIPGQGLTDLMGAVVENATAKIAGTKFSASGPLLLTHWGASGPAILKLSSYGARFLAECQYCTFIILNWLGEANEEDAKQLLQELASKYPSRQCSSVYPEVLSSRLWLHILQRSGIREDMRWAEMGRKGLARLASTLVCDTYQTRGRGHFKEEFVTCGGVSLSEISLKTLEAKKHPRLYFGGEVLDVDAITGGFNLQAAWSMGFVIAQSIAEKMKDEME